MRSPSEATSVVRPAATAVTRAGGIDRGDGGIGGAPGDGLAGHRMLPGVHHPGDEAQGRVLGQPEQRSRRRCGWPRAAGAPRSRACAMRPPAAATTVAAPGARATTTAPALSTEPPRYRCWSTPRARPGSTPPCASVMVVASWRVSPSDQAVSAAGATPIQRTCSAPVIDRTEERMRDEGGARRQRARPPLPRPDDPGRPRRPAPPRSVSTRPRSRYCIRSQAGCLLRPPSRGRRRCAAPRRSSSEPTKTTQLRPGWVWCVALACQPLAPASRISTRTPVLGPHVETVRRRRIRCRGRRDSAPGRRRPSAGRS